MTVPTLLLILRHGVNAKLLGAPQVIADLGDCPWMTQQTWVDLILAVHFCQLGYPICNVVAIRIIVFALFDDVELTGVAGIHAYGTLVLPVSGNRYISFFRLLLALCISPPI